MQHIHGHALSQHAFFFVPKFSPWPNANFLFCRKSYATEIKVIYSGLRCMKAIYWHILDVLLACVLVFLTRLVLLNFAWFGIMLTFLVLAIAGKACNERSSLTSTALFSFFRLALLGPCPRREKNLSNIFFGIFWCFCVKYFALGPRCCIHLLDDFACCSSVSVSGKGDIKAMFFFIGQFEGEMNSHKCVWFGWKPARCRGLGNLHQNRATLWFCCPHVHAVVPSQVQWLVGEQHKAKTLALVAASGSSKFFYPACPFNVNVFTAENEATGKWHLLGLFSLQLLATLS